MLSFHVTSKTNAKFLTEECEPHRDFKPHLPSLIPSCPKLGPSHHLLNSTHFQSSFHTFRSALRSAHTACLCLQLENSSSFTAHLQCFLLLEASPLSAGWPRPRSILHLFVLEFGDSFKASGGVDDDIQEPVEPGRFIICARDQRGERPSSWEKQAGDRFCFKVTLMRAPRDCHLLSRGQGNVRSRNTPIVASVSGTLGSSWVHNMGKPGTEKRRDRFSGQDRVGEHAAWMGCVCLSVQSIPLCVAACARV